MEYLQCVYAFLAGIPFCVFFHVRGSSIFWMSLGGAIGWFFYLFSAPVGNDILQFFIGTLALALYAEIMARVRRAPATGYLHVALFPLVPGGGIYYTMEYCIAGGHGPLSGNGHAHAEHGGRSGARHPGCLHAGADLRAPCRRGRRPHALNA